MNGGGDLQTYLDLALADAKLLANLVDVRLVRKGGELRLELGAEGGLLLGDELGAHVRPRSVVGGRDGQLRGGHVADLDLRLDLRLDHWQDRLVKIGANLDLRANTERTGQS